MLRLDEDHIVLEGPAGSLTLPADDEVARKLAMLYEGECLGLGASAAAKKYGYSRPRYYQVRHALALHGPRALVSEKRGPKTLYRRTDEVQRQVIRHRFLDPDASADVIAQKLRQNGFAVSVRSVQRVLEAYGLQKKTLRGRAAGSPR